MNFDQLRAASGVAQDAEKNRIAKHLAAGGKIDLLEAVGFCGIGRLRELWPLAQFDAVGRIGSPLEPMQAIPVTAWPVLRMVIMGADPVLETPEGLRVYDVCLSLPSDQSTPGQPPAQQADEQRAHVERDVDAAVVELIQRASQGAVSLADCETELGNVGVTVSKERIVGAVIDNTGRVVRGSGSTKLSNVLMAVQLRQNLPHYDGTRRDVTRRLSSWVRASFPQLRAVPQEYPENDELDRLAALLKRAGLM